MRHLRPGRWPVLFALVLGFFALGVPPACAQQATQGPTTLIADVVRLDGPDRLVAEGNVEVLSAGRRLRATRLTYDRTAERLTIDGPILLEDATGTLVAAERADLGADLEDGILTGARIILNDRLQIAGSEIVRSGGRFSDLRRVTASSCEVCLPGEAPLWEIRAARVIHDQDDAQIYFYDATFRIAGLPVFYLPALRVPDGTEPRVRGFLVPGIRSTTGIGTGVRLPYFIPFGDHADLTVAPFYTERDAATLEARYRQAFANGNLVINGAVSRDSILPDQTRGYLDAQADFAIPGDFLLALGLQLSSDDAYLRDYDFSEADRLESGVELLRVREAERIEARLTYFESLRADFDDRTEPDIVGDAHYDRRLAVAGGRAGWLDLGLVGQVFRRPSDRNIVGRDMAQMRATAGWQQAWTGPAGLRFGAEGQVHADLKQITDDNRFDQYQTGVTPEAALTASWPLIRTLPGGAWQGLEPIAQLVWTAENPISSPNDDSTAVAFGAGNLFSFNRFPGLDRIEEGARTNLALRWRHVTPGGLSLSVTGGKVLRFDHTDQFAPGSGLNGRGSDWLAQADLDIAGWLALRNLTLFDNALEPTQSETRIGFRAYGLILSSAYIWQREDRSSDLVDDISEVAATASYVLNDRWSGAVDLRHDFVIDRTNDRSLSLAYQNECVRVDLSVRQRFRATSDVEPTTTYGFEVTLAGFGSGANAVRRQRCAREG